MNPCCLTLTVLLSCLLTRGAIAGVAPVKIVPQPKQITFDDAAPLLLPAGTVGIVIGDKASEPEQYAAESLQKSVAKITGQNWPVLREGEDASKFRTLVLIGQRSTNKLLDGICTDQSIGLSDKSPGFDGYVMKFINRGGQDVVLIGGCNARATIFGQDTLTQLLSVSRGKVMLTKADLRDWPSVPWRGKPSTHVENHMQPGIMDEYMVARLNFIDLRNDIYAFHVGDTLQVDNIKKVVADAHRRGMIVFGTVACSLDRTKHDAVLAMFSQLIELGVDGLWVSFDDQGPGEDPVGLLTKVLELAKQHGIPSSYIAVTPPKGSYQVINGPFNKQILKMPGMQDALWFFTCIPSKEELAAAQALGLKRKLGWWHNWPKIPGNVTLSTNVPSYSFLTSGLGPKQGQLSYWPVPQLKYGWNEPSYRSLSDGGETTEAVMQWGGTEFKLEYTIPVFGWWGWAPENHDWSADRDRIYTRVYGAARVAVARKFDDLYEELTSYFVFPGAPCLKDQASRAQALRIVAKMEAELKVLEATKPADSWVDQKRLQNVFLGPARTEVATAKASIEAAWPEYWWDAHQRDVLNAICDGDTAKAGKLISEAEPRIVAELRNIEKAMPQAKVLDYATACKARASLDPSGWQRVLAERADEHARRIADFEYRKTGSFGKTMLRNLNTVPTELKLVGTVMPGTRQQFSGQWIGGPTQAGADKVYAFTYPLKQWERPGDYCEVDVSVPVHPHAGWKGLQFFLNTYANDEIAYEKVLGRWMGRSFIQLKYQDKVLWEADAGQPRGGGEWVTVALPNVGDDQTEIKLTLRVECRMASFNYGALVLIGPMRAVMAPI